MKLRIFLVLPALAAAQFAFDQVYQTQSLEFLSPYGSYYKSRSGFGVLPLTGSLPGGAITGTADAAYNGSLHGATDVLLSVGADSEAFSTSAVTGSANVTAPEGTVGGGMASLFFDLDGSMAPWTDYRLFNGGNATFSNTESQVNVDVTVTENGSQIYAGTIAIISLGYYSKPGAFTQERGFDDYKNFGATQWMAYFTGNNLNIPALQTNSFHVTPGLLDASVELDVTTTAGNSAGLPNVSAETDFTHTLSFASTAADLPAGWNLNSTDFSIVNNHYVTPEPAPLVILGLGVLGFFLKRKR